MRPSTRPATKRLRTKKESSASAFRIAPPRAPSGRRNKRSAGSATGRNGEPVAKGASASSSDAMDSIAAGTKATTGCTAGLDSASSATTLSTWDGTSPTGSKISANFTQQHKSDLSGPPVLPVGLLVCPLTQRQAPLIEHFPRKGILRQKVARTATGFSVSKRRREQSAQLLCPLRLRSRNP